MAMALIILFTLMTHPSMSHVNDLSMVGDMGIITRGEDSDMGAKCSEVSISLFSLRVIM